MMSSWLAILFLLLVFWGYIYLLVLLGTMTIDLVRILDVPAILNGTWWQKYVSVAEELDPNKFPIDEERIFSGAYISHWEIPCFRLMSVDCQLDIPFEGGWDWLVEALDYPTTRDGHTGTFNLKFRGKLVEKGCFGHMGMCHYRIEVLEILSVSRSVS
jgi:hypothetical protein